MLRWATFPRTPRRLRVALKRRTNRVRRSAVWTRSCPSRPRLLAHVVAALRLTPSKWVVRRNECVTLKPLAITLLYYFTMAHFLFSILEKKIICLKILCKCLEIMLKYTVYSRHVGDLLWWYVVPELWGEVRRMLRDSYQPHRQLRHALLWVRQRRARAKIRLHVSGNVGHSWSQ